MPNSERMIESQGLHPFAHLKGPMNLFVRTGAGENTHRVGKPRLQYEAFGLLAKKESHGIALLVCVRTHPVPNHLKAGRIGQHRFGGFACPITRYANSSDNDHAIPQTQHAFQSHQIPSHQIPCHCMMFFGMIQSKIGFRVMAGEFLSNRHRVANHQPLESKRKAGTVRAKKKRLHVAVELLCIHRRKQLSTGDTKRDHPTAECTSSCPVTRKTCLKNYKPRTLRTPAP